MTDIGKKQVGTLSHAEVNVTCPECDWLVRWTKMTPIGEMCLECEQDYLERRLFAYDNDEP